LKKLLSTKNLRKIVFSKMLNEFGARKKLFALPLKKLLKAWKITEGSRKKSEWIISFIPLQPPLSGGKTPSSSPKPIYHGRIKLAQ
jgi:hypothetical protein